MKKKIGKITVFAILLLTVLCLIVFNFIPKTSYLVWRVASVCEFKTLRMISSLLSERPNNSVSSKNYLASHRGAFSKTVAENSEKSIILAAQRGFRHIELDVTFTKEHIPIIFHDLNLKHKANLDRATDDVSWEEINKLKLFDDQKILTLQKLLSEFGSLFDAIILDVKIENKLIEERANYFIKIVKESDCLAEIYVIGRNCLFLSKLKNIDPELKVGCENQGVFYNYIKDFDITSLHYESQFSYLEHFIANKFDMSLILWTINNHQDLKQLRYLENAIILTDLHDVN